MTFTSEFIHESLKIIEKIDQNSIDQVINIISETRDKNGRIFFIGAGGSAANASHAVNDFRKLANIECYSPTDNVAELTARTNDEGWDSTFSGWLKVSKLNSKDLIFVFSVGGGDIEKNVSPNIVKAISLAKSVKSKIVGVIGRDGGYTKINADACILIPTENPKHVTPMTESLHVLMWHLIITHPKIAVNKTKW
jgi:D-sedoheptulose 7-phosphate isomerase